MENINAFGELLREVREARFPGQSLRRVGEYLADKHGFKEYFYTQLNKMEMGIVLPSSGLLGRLLDAYDVSTAVREKAFDTFIAQSTAQTSRIAAEDIGVRRSMAEETATVLYRKVKKHK